MTTSELKTFRSSVTKLARLHAQSQKLAASHAGQNKLWTRRAAERDVQFEVCRRLAVCLFSVPEPKMETDRSTYPLFKHLSDAHGLTPLETELHEIVLLAKVVEI